MSQYRCRPYNDNRRSNIVIIPADKQDQQEQRPGMFTRLFTKEKRELFVIDFVTPHASLRCAHEGCNLPDVIPLTGFCVNHDPLCALLTIAAMTKAAAEANKETPMARAYEDLPENWNERMMH